MLKIDHVAIIAPDLDATCAELREAGLETCDGGYNYLEEGGELKRALRHRDVPLGNDQYIEVEQVLDNRTAGSASSRWPGFLADLGDRADREGPLLLTFWVLSDDFEKQRARLGLVAQTHHRRRPDGFQLSCQVAPWTMDAITRGVPPFFRFETPLEGHPGRIRVDHGMPPTGIAWLEIGGEKARMHEWLGPDAEILPLRYVGGQPGLHGIGISTESGKVIEIRRGRGRLAITQTA